MTNRTPDVLLSPPRAQNSPAPRANSTCSFCAMSARRAGSSSMAMVRSSPFRKVLVTHRCGSESASCIAGPPGWYPAAASPLRNSSKGSSAAQSGSRSSSVQGCLRAKRTERAMDTGSPGRAS